MHQNHTPTASHARKNQVLWDDHLGCYKIVLTEGKVALVDACDLDAVASIRWRTMSHRGLFYARSALRHKQDGWVLMHRLIMTPPKEMSVDHINGDGLDNRRQNLRICTHAENMRNRQKPQRDNTSGYAGVDRHRNRWRARIKHNGVRIHLGLFRTAEEAAIARDKAAMELHGEFAYLNFPHHGSPSDDETR